jgi:hypothetical protein
MHGAVYGDTRSAPAAEPEPRTVAWYYRAPGGEVLGPSGIETLCTLLLSTRNGLGAAEDALVRPDGSSRFVRVRDAPALLRMLHSRAGQPPSPSSFRGVADYGTGRAPAMKDLASDWCAPQGWAGVLATRC